MRRIVLAGVMVELEEAHLARPWQTVHSLFLELRDQVQLKVQEIQMV